MAWPHQHGAIRKQKVSVSICVPNSSTFHVRCLRPSMATGSQVVRVAVIAWWVLWGAACARTPRIVAPETEGIDHGSLTALLARHPLAATQNISALPLGRTDAISYHLV